MSILNSIGDRYTGSGQGAYTIYPNSPLKFYDNGKVTGMKKLTIKQIDDLLKQKDIDPALKESLKKKKEILSNDKMIRK